MSVAIGDHELDLSTRRAWPGRSLNAVRDRRGDGSRVATVAKADGLGLPIFELVSVAREPGGPGRCVVETFRFEGGRLDEISSTLSSINGYRKARISPAITLPVGDAVRLYTPALPKRGQDVSDTYV